MSVQDMVLFTGHLSKKQMQQFKKEAEKQGISRIALLRIWIARECGKGVQNAD